jgi:hypothetical protein
LALFLKLLLDVLAVLLAQVPIGDRGHAPAQLLNDDLPLVHTHEISLNGITLGVGPFAGGQRLGNGPKGEKQQWQQ